MNGRNAKRFSFIRRRIVAFGIACAFITTALGCSRGPSAIGPAPDASADPVALAQQLNDQAEAIPQERYDLDARAASLGPGMAPALAVARDEIRAESYPGVLLGASGAYRNRGGNSLDRSLLLAHLLVAKGMNVRFASCKLDASTAETLAAQLFTPAPAAASAATAAPDPLYERIVARGDRDFAAVRSALGGSPAYAGMSHADLVNELSDHTWVQASTDGATWTDLDPSFPDAAPGKQYCKPAATAPVPDDDENQSVTIRVGGETLDGGTLSDATLIEQTYPAYALLDRQIYVLQRPESGSMLGQSGPKNYAPVLAVDGDVTAGTAVSFTDGSHGGGNAIGGLAGGLAGGDAPATGAAGGPYLVAEWLEFVVTEPGGKTDTTRRYLFDRGGEAWRASADHDPTKLAAMHADAKGPLPAQAVYGICITAGRHDVRGYKAALATIVRAAANARGASPAPAASASDGDGDVFASLWPFAIRNFGFTEESDERVIPALSDRPDVRFYADSPRIFVFGAGPDPAGSGGTFLDFDLRRDSVRALAKDASGAAAVADGVLRFGVMEGALEAELAAPSQAQRGAGATFASTSDLLGPDGLTVLKPGSDLSGVADAETAARLESALRAGATAVVPSEVLRGGPNGWWEIAADGSSVRSVFGENLGGATFGLPGNAYVNPAYGSGLEWHVDPKTMESIAYRNGKPVSFKPPAPKRKGGDEYTLLLLSVAFTVSLIVTLISYEMLFRQAQAANGLEP